MLVYALAFFVFAVVFSVRILEHPTISCLGTLLPSLILQQHFIHFSCSCHLQMPGPAVNVSLWSCPRSEVELSPRTLNYRLYFFDGHHRSYMTNAVWSMFVYFCTDILENKEIIYPFTYACFRTQQYFFVFCSSEKESCVAQTVFELTI